MYPPSLFLHNNKKYRDKLFILFLHITSLKYINSHA